MIRAKAFFYVSLGVLALVVAFHLGATSAESQSGTEIVGLAGAGANGQTPIAILANGDSYAAGYSTITGAWTWHFTGNLYAGAPVNVNQTTWGRIKAERR